MLTLDGAEAVFVLKKNFPCVPLALDLFLGGVVRMEVL